MPHLPPQPDRSQIAEEELEAYDRVVRSRAAYTRRSEAGKADVFYGALLNSPTLADLLNDSVRYLVGAAARGTFSHADREWVDMVLAQELGWDAVFYGHMPDAVALGVRPEAIKALRTQRDEDLDSGRASARGVIRRVLNGTVTAESCPCRSARRARRRRVHRADLPVDHDRAADEGVRPSRLPAIRRRDRQERLQHLLDGGGPAPDVMLPSLAGYLDGLVELPR